MSYARWGPDSDVYVFAADGGVACCDCAITVTLVAHTYTDYLGFLHVEGDKEWFGETLVFTDVDSLIAHLRDHMAEGQAVPGALLNPDTYDPEDFTRP